MSPFCQRSKDFIAERVGTRKTQRKVQMLEKVEEEQWYRCIIILGQAKDPVGMSTRFESCVRRIQEKIFWRKITRINEEI
jgi:hypothetical protein